MAQAIASAEQQTGGKAIGSGIEDQDGAIFLEVTVLKDGQRRKVLVDATASPEMMIGSWCGTKFVPRRVASRPGLSDVAAVRHNAVQIKSSLIPAARPGDADHGTALFFEKDSQEPPVLLVHGSCCDHIIRIPGEGLGLDSCAVAKRVGWCAMSRGGRPWRELLVI